jgi:hypothetical protein
MRDSARSSDRAFFLPQSRNRKPQDELQRPRTAPSMAELRGIEVLAALADSRDIGGKHYEEL